MGGGTKRSGRLRSWWGSVGVFGWVRAAVAVLGAAGFGFGIGIATYNADSGTLLISSAVLIVAALLLSPDWTRIVGEIAGNKFELNRDPKLELLRETTDALIDAANTAESYDAFRDSVAPISAQVAGISRWNRLPTTEEWSAAMSDETRRPISGWSVRDGKAFLTITLEAGDPVVPTCAIHLTGESPSQLNMVAARPVHSLLTQRPSYMVVFPDDFEGQASVPGNYTAIWKTYYGTSQLWFDI